MVPPAPERHMIRRAAVGHMPAEVDRGANIVQADNGTQGLHLARGRDRPEKGYVPDGCNMTLAWLRQADRPA